MARKQTPESLPPPRLTVPRDEAAIKINAQIEKGLRLKETAIQSEDDLRKARAEKLKWSQYNIELLTRLFDNPSVAQEYNPPRVFIAGGDEYLHEKVQSFIEDVDYYITRLESISARLELIPEPFHNIKPISFDEPKDTNSSSKHIQADTKGFEREF
jgi:hypothetical protein